MGKTRTSAIDIGYNNAAREFFHLRVALFLEGVRDIGEGGGTLKCEEIAKRPIRLLSVSKVVSTCAKILSFAARQMIAKNFQNVSISIHIMYSRHKDAGKSVGQQSDQDYIHCVLMSFPCFHGSAALGMPSRPVNVAGLFIRIGSTATNSTRMQPAPRGSGML